MLKRHFDSCLVSPANIQPSRDDFEVAGVFNPGVIATGNGDEVVLLARVAERPKEQRPGQTPLLGWNTETSEIIVDWVSNDEYPLVDPRVVQHKDTGLWRLTFTSHLRVIRSPDGRSVESLEGPRMLPQNLYEEYGVEDARITKIGDTFYITYVAVSRHGPATALASTKDFETFERHGIIFCPENKDVVIFPEKINGRYVALHRPTPFSPFNMPEMWLARSDDLVNWGAHEFFLGGGGGWDNGRIGGGTPPIRTDAGWLHIYHGKQKDPVEGAVGAYAAGALLMDIEQPKKIKAITREPILTAEAPHERDGFVPRVIFPTGVVQRGDALLIYSGGADTNVGVAEVSWKELRAALG